MKKIYFKRRQYLFSFSEYGFYEIVHVDLCFEKPDSFLQADIYCIPENVDFFSNTFCQDCLWKLRVLKVG